MNKLSKKTRTIITMAMMLCVTLSTLAHDFEVDGIYYNYLDKNAKTVEVTYKGNSYSSYFDEYTNHITIPSSINYNGMTYIVSSIGPYAFKNNPNLTSITIPNSISIINLGAFTDCTKLTSLKIEDGTNELIMTYSYENYNTNGLGEGLFYDCPLETIYIGRNLNYVGCSSKKHGYSPFYGNKAIKAVTIGNSVTYISTYAFGECTHLSSVTIGNSVKKIYSSAFLACSALTEVTIPDLTIEIGSSAFSDCSSLTEVTIPNSVTKINEEAFNRCTNLSSISLGNSIATIGTSAFGDCNNLLYVKSYNPIPQNIDANAFSSTTYTNAILTVPYKCNDLYACRTGWGSFNTIIEMEMPSIYLTIKLPESGIITHKEVYDEVAELSFKANDGWQINTISFNEDDVTSQLDDEGNYTTPVLTEDATLSVVFEKIPTGIEPISMTNDIKVYAKDGFVEIIGADADSVVNINDTMGISKYIGKDNRIYLEDNGIYILTVEGRTFKFTM